jgi:hypothetical protein
MEKILAIRGDIFGNRVIDILESLGGYNRFNISETDFDFFYYIDHNGDITCIRQDQMIITKYMTYTIDSFLEVYPYTIDDNVILSSKVRVKITNMYIDENGCVVYEGNTDIGGFISPISVVQIVSKIDSTNDIDVTHTDEPTDKAKAPVLNGSDYGLTGHGYTIPDGYEFVEVRKDFCGRDEILLRKKAPVYPSTYEGCCRVLGLTPEANYATGYKSKELTDLQDLIICIDAYWKLSGYWQPAENELTCRFIIALDYSTNSVIKKDVVTVSPYLAEFPTADARDKFFESFSKDILDKAKKFL